MRAVRLPSATAATHSNTYTPPPLLQRCREHSICAVATTTVASVLSAGYRDRIAVRAVAVAVQRLQQQQPRRTAHAAPLDISAQHVSL